MEFYRLHPVVAVPRDSSEDFACSQCGAKTEEFEGDDEQAYLRCLDEHCGAVEPIY